MNKNKIIKNLIKDKIQELYEYKLNLNNYLIEIETKIIIEAKIEKELDLYLKLLKDYD